MTVAVIDPPRTATVPTRLAEGAFAVATHGLVKRYKRETALGGVDLQVPEGAVYVLAGANGAGKSTLLRTLMNMERPDEGRAEVLGLEPRRAGARVRAQIGYVPEGTEAGYRWMKVGRLIEHQALYFPTWDHEYAARLSRVLEIRPERALGHLSKGQTRRVQLLLALAHRPRLLLLDEPTDGLDPVARDEVLSLLAEHLADTGCTVLISTHLVNEVDRVADHVGVLRAGRLVVQTSREEMHRMLRAYRAEGPDGWVGPAEVPGVVLRRTGVGRDQRWIVWGEERAVAERIGGSGGVVRDAAPLGLDEAVVALLRWKETT
ncbi:MAG TPA: ABC transporter ATP-binding protein [Caulobacteraceae bacterium]|jgi:ABC-2 type transport system ATP-binding protein